MRLIFRTIVDEETIEKEVDFVRDNETISFMDNQTKNSFIPLTEGIKLVREGQIKQEILFLPNKITKTTLIDEFDLQMDFFVYTEVVKQTMKGIYIKYSLFVGQEKLSQHKIWLKYLANTSKID